MLVSDWTKISNDYALGVQRWTSWVDRLITLKRKLDDYRNSRLANDPTLAFMQDVNFHFPINRWDENERDNVRDVRAYCIPSEDGTKKLLRVEVYSFSVLCMDMPFISTDVFAALDYLESAYEVLFEAYDGLKDSWDPKFHSYSDIEMCRKRMEEVFEGLRFRIVSLLEKCKYDQVHLDSISIKGLRDALVENRARISDITPHPTKEETLVVSFFQKHYTLELPECWL